MGRAAILAGQFAEMLIPTLLLFAVTYTAAKTSLKQSNSILRIVALFALSFLISGILNVIFYKLTSDRAFGTFVFLGIPLVISLAVIACLGKRTAAKSAGEDRSST